MPTYKQRLAQWVKEVAMAYRCPGCLAPTVTHYMSTSCALLHGAPLLQLLQSQGRPSLCGADLHGLDWVCYPGDFH